MTECYRYAVDTYAQMPEDEKAKISLELLYNAICYYHGMQKKSSTNCSIWIRQLSANLGPR